MADTFLLTDLSIEIDVVYNAATQPNYALHYGSRIKSQETNVLQHKPDDGDSLPIKAADPDREAFFTLHVLADTDEDINDIENLIAVMKLWVDGKHQQALRYHLIKDVDEIFLKVQPDGSTNATLHSVKWGFVDDSGAFYTDQKRGSGFAKDITVMLVLTPTGQAENDIVLKNDLFNSPHFLEESVTAGLAAGWTNIGTATLTLSTTTHLIGGQSQKVVYGSDASGVGIESDTVVNTADTDVVAYAWVYVEAGSEPRLRIIDKDNADNPLVTVNCIAGNEDKSVIGPDGNTWRRFSVSYDSIATNNDVALKIDSLNRGSGAPTFYVDGAYLELGSLVVPDAFMSTRKISNRNDYGTGSQAEENRLNYIDTWGIPGDVPALARFDFTIAANNDAEGTIGAMRTNTTLNRKHWAEADEFDRTLSNWTNPTDANRTGGSYLQTVTWPAGAFDRIVGPSLGLGWKHLQRGVRVIILMNASHSSIGLKFRARYDNVAYHASEFLSPSTLSAWCAVDYGIVNFKGLLPEIDRHTGGGLTISIEPEGTSGTLQVDAVLLFPTEQFIYVPTFDAITSRVIDGIGKEVSRRVSDQAHIRQSALGSLWTVEAGKTMSRDIFFFIGDDTDADYEQYDHTETAAVELTIRPRTRHLLGT